MFQVGEGDLARYVFDWGRRATEEWSKKDVLQKMATVNIGIILNPISAKKLSRGCTANS